jgi:NTE family protein
VIETTTGIGLVLGGGGVVGQTHHAGVLAALEHDLGWDPRTADVIVGTSAGSITGALLRADVPASELAAWAVQAPLSAEGALLEDLFGTEHPTFTPFRVGDVLTQPMSPPSLSMVIRALRRPWRVRPLSAGMALLPPGRHDITEQLTALKQVEDVDWPDQPLWICAVRRADARRVVFGRPGTPRVPLHLAIAASCAVPGHFAPVTVDQHAYIDGGVHSSTNAAVLRGHGLRLIVVIAPMAGPTKGPHRGVYEASRWQASRLLQREVKALRRSGSEVVVFTPDARVQRAMGDDFMSAGNLDEILQQAFFQAGAIAARSPIRERIAALRLVGQLT